jgi:hypothetical protein
MCAKHHPSNEKLDTKQKGGGRNFSSTRESNLFKDHSEKVQKLQKRQKNEQAENYATKVQAHATSNMVATTLRKVAILEDHASMVLFTMLKNQLVMKETLEYFKLCRCE